MHRLIEVIAYTPYIIYIYEILLNVFIKSEYIYRHEVKVFFYVLELNPLFTATIFTLKLQ